MIPAYINEGLTVNQRSFILYFQGGAVSVSSIEKKEKFTFGRMDSIRAFNTGSEANEMLRGLRYFERGIQSKDPKLKDKPQYSWGPVSIKYSRPS